MDSISMPVPFFRSSYYSIAAGVFIWVCTASIPQIYAQTITIDPTISYQSFKHWEGVDFVGQILETNTLGTSKVNPAWPYYKDEVIDKLVTDMGINRVRMEFKGGLENNVEDYYLDYLDGNITYMQLNSFRANPVNDNSDPNVINWNGFQFAEIDHTMNEIIIPMRNKLLADRGETLWINLCHVGNDEKGILHVNSPEEYAEIMLAIFMHMNDSFGIVPNSIEMTLEPDYGGSPWTAEKIVNNLLATQARLAAHNFHPRFIVPSVTNAPNLINWWPWMKAVNTTWLQYVDEASTHRYGSPSNTQLDQNQAMVEADGKRLSQLEFIGANYHMLHDDLKRNHIAWAQYVLATYYSTDPQSAYYGVDQSDPANPQVMVSTLAKYFRHYMRYIRPDAVRKKSTTTNSNFDPVAFENADGNYTVVVKASTAGDFSIGGLPAGNYHLRYTTDSETMVDPGDQFTAAGENITTSIPGAGVLTIFADEIEMPVDTCMAHAGNDTALCTFYGLDTFYLGGQPTSSGGTGPYTYRWSASYEGFVKTYTASFFLDDTTSANPRLMHSVHGPVTFYLEAMDSLGIMCFDSITIEFSRWGITLDVKHCQIVEGDSCQLYTSVHGGIPPLTYSWTPVTGLADPHDVFTMASPDTTTTYTLLVTDSAGCQVEDLFYVSVIPVGLDENIEVSINMILYPNPALEEIILDIKDELSTSILIEIINTDGHTLVTKNVFANNPEHIAISHLIPGLYIVKATHPERMGMIRFIKIK